MIHLTTRPPNLFKTRPPRYVSTATEAFEANEFDRLFAIAAMPEASSSVDVLSLVVRARARTRQTAAALKALETVASQDSEAAAAVLRTLRLHADTASLRDSRRFRQLVRYVPIEVSPTSAGDGPRLAPLVAALREASLPARVGKRWRGKSDGATIFYTTELPEAEAVAKELRDALSLPPTLLASRYLKRQRPIVLVLPTNAVGSLNPTGETTRIEAFYGKVLVATHGGTTHRFTLKATGFFSWTSVPSKGATVERTGRYHLGAASIALSFRRVEHKGDAEEPSKVQLGRRSSHRFRLRASGFKLDSLEFRTAP